MSLTNIQIWTLLEQGGERLMGWHGRGTPYTRPARKLRINNSPLRSLGYSATKGTIIRVDSTRLPKWQEKPPPVIKPRYANAVRISPCEIQLLQSIRKEQNIKLIDMHHLNTPLRELTQTELKVLTWDCQRSNLKLVFVRKGSEIQEYAWAEKTSDFIVLHGDNKLKAVALQYYEKLSRHPNLFFASTLETRYLSYPLLSQSNLFGTVSNEVEMRIFCLLRDMEHAGRTSATQCMAVAAKTIFKWGMNHELKFETLNVQEYNNATDFHPIFYKQKHDENQYQDKKILAGKIIKILRHSAPVPIRELSRQLKNTEPTTIVDDLETTLRDLTKLLGVFCIVESYSTGVKVRGVLVDSLLPFLNPAQKIDDRINLKELFHYYRKIRLTPNLLYSEKPF